MKNEKITINRNDLVNAIIQTNKSTYDNLYYEFLDVFDLLIDKEIENDSYVTFLSVNLSNEAKNFLLKSSQ